MSKTKKKQPVSIGDISPTLYREYLGKVHLVELSLIKIDSEIFKDKFIPENNPSIQINDQYRIIPVDKKIVKSVSDFELIVLIGKSETKILSVNASYEIVLHVDIELPATFWEIYKTATLPLKLWPYFRELVQNLTSRMNIPPLTLPILFK